MNPPSRDSGVTGGLDRRSLIAMGVAAAAARPAAAEATGRAIVFQIMRNDARIGSHSVTLSARGGRLEATITAAMRVMLGPIPLFKYRHDAVEVWADGRFVSLTSRTVTNGKVDTVDARASDDGVLIVRNGTTRAVASARSAPLTHWNRAALARPLFNPQTGALLRCQVKDAGVQAVRDADGKSRAARAFQITGDTAITDWYDEADVWAALEAKGPDGSRIDYRRVRG